MEKFVKKKGGFTLIELLLVIFIMGSLSVLAINGYTEYRRTALLDFAADSFVAQFYELRDNAIHGDFGGSEYEDIKAALVDDAVEYGGTDVGAKCFGIYISNATGGYEMRKFELPYVGVKSFVGFAWEEEGCDFEELGSLVPLSDFNFDESVGVVEVNSESGAVLNELVIGFAPPDGEIQVLVDGYGDVMDEGVVVTFMYGESGKEKRVFVDLESGKSYVINENE